MFWFLKEIEKQTGKQSTNLVLNVCHSKTNMWHMHNYANNKSCIHLNIEPQMPRFGDFIVWQTKDLQKMPLENWIFLHLLSLENVAQINKNNYGTMFFMSKQVGVLKISSILQKIKISPKSYIHPFCTKALN